MARSSDQSPRHLPGWPAFLRRIALVGGLSGGLMAVAGADTVPSSATRDDDQLALRARKALWDDPVLVKLNLGVRVRQGVVTLHGPVPFASIAEQAVACVRRLTGVREVVNELYVVGAGDPLGKVMQPPVTARRSPPNPPATQARSPNDPAKTTDPGAGAVVVTAPLAMPAAPLSLIEQIAQLRERNRRFRDIRIEVRGGHVTLRGRVEQSQDAWEFAKMVRELSRVTSVMQSIATGP